jgi:hypothetical protein
VEQGRGRILVGRDAGFLALLTRIAPVRYFEVLQRLEPYMRR